MLVKLTSDGAKKTVVINRSKVIHHCQHNKCQGVCMTSGSQPLSSWRPKSIIKYNGKPALLVHCLYQMSPLSHKRPPLFYVEKNWQLKDRRFPIGCKVMHNKLWRPKLSSRDPPVEKHFSVLVLVSRMSLKPLL